MAEWTFFVEDGEFQLERLRELDQEAVNRRRAERDAKRDKK